MMGRKKLPKAAGIDGIMKSHTIDDAVHREQAVVGVCASTMVGPG
jgi:hypothetical protein